MEDFEQEKAPNPNNIGELMSVSRDVETFANRVYRSVSDRAAIDDLVTSGVVRNKQSAGLGESRWGENVYWSRGEEGKYHIVQQGGYVIEAPYNIASERQVTIDDLTAIYHKTEDAEVRDVLEDVLRESL
jgi:hypothetical protein